MTDVALLAVVLAAAFTAATWWRARQGRVRAVDDRLSADERATIAAPEGATVLLLFTAPACGSCATAKRVIDAAAPARDDVVVLSADVADTPELARAHKVLRAPTTLVIDASGQVRARIGGVPDQAELARLLDAA